MKIEGLEVWDGFDLDRLSDFDDAVVVGKVSILDYQRERDEAIRSRLDEQVTKWD